MTLHVFTGECDKVVAESPDDAWVVWCEATGESRCDYEDDFEFEVEPDDKLLTIWSDDTAFDQCECVAKIAAHEATVAKQVKLIEAQPKAARPAMWTAVAKMLPTYPNGHLMDCAKGFERKTCEQWATDQGRGFLCSTEY